MNIYKIWLEYKGTRFSGFQVQSSALTIQGELNTALSTIAKTTEIKTIGSGRTDAGVHAFAQVVKIEMPLEINPDGLMRALNSHLPPDIRVKKAESSSSDFHPIFSALSKEYNYVFATQEVASVFGHELMTIVPYELDIDLMRRGCQIFCGQHDFINYQCTGTEVQSTVRTIFSCDIEEFIADGHWSGVASKYYVLKIVGDGFLKQMVRLIMGALFNLGRHKIKLEDIENSFNSPLKNRLGPTAPPQGLYLKKVHY